MGLLRYAENGNLVILYSLTMQHVRPLRRLPEIQQYPITARPIGQRGFGENSMEIHLIRLGGHIELTCFNHLVKSIFVLVSLREAMNATAGENGSRSWLHWLHCTAPLCCVAKVVEPVWLCTALCACGSKYGMAIWDECFPIKKP